MGLDATIVEWGRSFDRGSVGRGTGRALRASIDRRLRRHFPKDAPNELEAPMRHVVLAPGKRLRPALTVLASWDLGVDDLRALDAGCSLEMIHAASLIFDDLPCMDDALTRRGVPATHIAFGEDAAILAGIALIGRAFETVTGTSELDGAQRAECARALSVAIGVSGLAGGQMRDLRGGTLDGLKDAHHRKTGALFVCAVEMAGIVARASETRMAELRHFATELGHAFQILDDLDDGVAETTAEDAGKTTILSFMGPDGARQRLARHLAEARRGLRPGGGLATFLSGIFGDGPGHGGARDSRVLA